MCRSRRIVARAARWRAAASGKRSRPFAGALLAALCVLGAARVAGAQCAFQHPKKAKQFRTSLVQAFLPCECYDDCVVIPDPPYVLCTPVCGNTTTEGGLTACTPPETFADLGGFSGGWRWNPSSSSGDVALRARPACTAVSHGTSTPPCDPASPLNPAGTADLEIKLKLRGVETLYGPANGSGHLTLILDITLADPMNGDMSLVWLPASIPFDLVNGVASVETSLDAVLNHMDGGGLPGVPACTSIHVVTVGVYDGDGSQFANMGVLLPVQ